MSEAIFRYPPGPPRSARDLEVGLLTCLLRDAREAILAVRRLPPAPADSPFCQALREEATRFLCTCQRGVLNMERSYLLMDRTREARREAEAAQWAHFVALVDRLRAIGTDRLTDAWTLLGWIDGHPHRPLCLPRHRGHVILISGIPGSGKTLLSTLIGEGAFHAGTPIASTKLPHTAYIFFHLEENDRLPQLLDALKPNPVAADLEILKTHLGVGGLALPRLRLAIPEILLTEELWARLRPYEDLGLEVVPLKLRLGEIGQPGLEAALQADGTRVVQRMLEDAQDQGDDLSTAGMEAFIEERAEDLNVTQKKMALTRLRVLKLIESPKGGPGIDDLVEPDVTTVVYLGGPHMGRGRVSPILVSVFSALMMPSKKHGSFQRVVAVDEINLLHKDDDAWRMFLRAARLARHRGLTLILMGQDLMCVPDEMFNVAGICAVFRQASPQVWEHQRQRIGGLQGYRWSDVASLQVAEAIVTSLESTDGEKARKVRFRPPLCMHGGFTRAEV